MANTPLKSRPSEYLDESQLLIKPIERIENIHNVRYHNSQCISADISGIAMEILCGSKSVNFPILYMYYFHNNLFNFKLAFRFLSDLC